MSGRDATPRARHVHPHAGYPLPCPVSGNGTGATNDSIDVIGAHGRVGGAVSERPAARGDLDAEPELVLLCVPDRAISEVAAAVAPGPWVAHVRAQPASPRSSRTRAGSRCTRCRRSRGARRRAARRRLGGRDRRERERAGGRLGSRRTLASAPSSSTTTPARRTTRGAAVASNYLVTLHDRRRPAPRGGGRAARGARSR